MKLILLLPLMNRQVKKRINLHLQILKEVEAEVEEEAEAYAPAVGFTVDHIFLTDELIFNIVTETNRYARQTLESTDITEHSRLNTWKDVTSEDIRNYLALTILMGLSNLPSIADYWSMNPLYHNKVYHAVMSRNRYQIISRFLHFNNNDKYDPKDPNRDKLYKVRPLLEYLIERFQDAYKPSKEVSIDEQLLLHKGRLSFRQYIPNKRARFGIKMFSLCDQTGYLYNTEVYVGKNFGEQEKKDDKTKLGKTGQVVMRLMQPILDSGHQLYLDNWYTSHALFKTLIDRNTAACGTVRKNRVQFPKEFKTKKMEKPHTLSTITSLLYAIKIKRMSSFYRRCIDQD